MAIRKIARMGNPVLRKTARPLTREEILSPKMQEFVQDMLDTMHEYGGIGLAAPQVHESIQLALIEFGEESGRYPGMGEQSLLVLFNPVVTVLDSQLQGFWEGCLSVPELRGLVGRPRKIKVDYLDEKAEPKTIEAEGFLATVFQHELDHLDGILYVDKLADPTKLAFTEEFKRYIAPLAQESELD